MVIFRIKKRANKSVPGGRSRNGSRTGKSLLARKVKSAANKAVRKKPAKQRRQLTAIIYANIGTSILLAIMGKLRKPKRHFKQSNTYRF